MDEEYDFSKGEHGKFAKRYAAAHGDPATSSINEPILTLASFKDEALILGETGIDDKTPIGTRCENVTKPLASFTDKTIPIERSKNE